MAVKGIDVSNHQGVIDWPAVRAAGIDFAFIKATQGINFRDQFFARNWKGAKDAGIQRGAYHFMEPYNNLDARNEADFFWKVVVEENGFEETDMLVLDAETTHTQFDGDYGNWCLYWLQVIQSYTKYTPLIYTAPDYINRLNLNNPELGAYGLWLAQWVVNQNPTTIPKPPVDSPWNLTAFWQHTEKGRVNGVPGLCDKNLFNGTLEQMKLYGKLTKENPQPLPTPIDVEAIEGHLQYIELANETIVAHTKDIAAHINVIRSLLVGPNPPA